MAIPSSQPTRLADVARRQAFKVYGKAVAYLLLGYLAFMSTVGLLFGLDVLSDASPPLGFLVTTAAGREWVDSDPVSSVPFGSHIGIDGLRVVHAIMMLTALGLTMRQFVAPIKGGRLHRATGAIFAAIIFVAMSMIAIWLPHDSVGELAWALFQMSMLVGGIGAAAVIRDVPPGRLRRFIVFAHVFLISAFWLTATLDDIMIEWFDAYAASFRR